VTKDSPPPYDAVLFDCDSTLSAIEGIEELAASRPPAVRAKLADLTAAAMDGRIALERVYGERLALVAPTRAEVAAVGGRYVETALPHARELVAALRATGKRVVVLSGGLRAAVLVLSDWLGLGADDVQAVPLSHARDGAYAGFDAAHPLARSGGKLEALRALGAPAVRVALVGDGATDLEAAPLAARFVAFGGVVARRPVMEAAAVSCETPDLAALLPLLLHPSEISALARRGGHEPLLSAARRATPDRSLP
jgi:phosphoserine phosphatase